MALSTIIYLIGTEYKHTLEMCFAAIRNMANKPNTVPDMNTICGEGEGKVIAIDLGLVSYGS